MDRHRRAYGIAFAAVLALALGLRLLYLHQVAALPFFDHPVGESAVHLGLAADIARGHWIPDRAFFYASVLYPYFLAVVLLLHGGPFAVALLQVLGGVLLVGLIGALGSRLHGRAAGLAAAGLAALYGPFAFMEADVVGIVWALVGIAAALLLAVRWSDRLSATARATHGGLALAGMALGIAAAERPNLALLLPVVAAWCGWRAMRAGARAIAPALTVVIAGLLPLGLVLALDVMAAREWVPLATSRGINLYIGNHPGADGTYDEPWTQDRSVGNAAQFNARFTDIEESSERMAETLAGRALTPEQASKFWSARAMRYIATHPGATALVTLRKGLLLLNDAEIPNHLDFAFIRERAPALALMPVGFGLTLALAVLGAGWAWVIGRRRAEHLLLLAVAAVAGASVLPFFVAERYRAPLVPSLLVLAGAGVAAVVGHIVRPEPQRRWNPRLWGVLAGAAAAACVSVVPLVRPIVSRDYWMFAQAYEARGDHAAAASAYEAAVASGGDDGELLNNLALVYRSMGDRPRAEVTFRRAIAVAPGLAYPHKNLGIMLIGRGAMEEARRELEQASRLEPEDVEALGALGALAAERGDRAIAADCFGRARALAPDDRRLARLAASYGYGGGAAPAR